MSPHTATSTVTKHYYSLFCISKPKQFILYIGTPQTTSNIINSFKMVYTVEYIAVENYRWRVCDEQLSKGDWCAWSGRVYCTGKKQQPQLIYWRRRQLQNAQNFIQVLLTTYWNSYLQAQHHISDAARISEWLLSMLSQYALCRVGGQAGKGFICRLVRYVCICDVCMLRELISRTG